MAPHVGGLWESAVKSTKYHLVRITQNSRLTFEEMSTLLSQIEAILNSRPLYPIQSNDPASIDVLTPGHFLSMGPLTMFPDPDVSHINSSRLDRWQQIQHLMRTFWKKYSTEYLHTLQQRQKWKTPKSNLQIDDVVVLREEGLPPCSWALAKITELHPGKDGLVRVVTVKTATTTLKRPINKIVLLPIR